MLRADMLGNPVAAQANIDKTGKTERITEMLGLRSNLTVGNYYQAQDTRIRRSREG